MKVKGHDQMFSFKVESEMILDFSICLKPHQFLHMSNVPCQWYNGRLTRYFIDDYLVVLDISPSSI